MITRPVVHTGSGPSRFGATLLSIVRSRWTLSIHDKYIQANRAGPRGDLRFSATVMEDTANSDVRIEARTSTTTISRIRTGRASRALIINLTGPTLSTSVPAAPPDSEERALREVKILDVMLSAIDRKENKNPSTGEEHHSLGNSRYVLLLLKDAIY